MILENPNEPIVIYHFPWFEMRFPFEKYNQIQDCARGKIKFSYGRGIYMANVV